LPLPDIRLEDLEAFHLAVASGSLSAAGRALGRSTKQVSRQVARLETALGQPLLHRTTHALSLTPHGRRFLSVAESMLALGADGVALVSAEDEGLSGELHVVLPSLNLGVTEWVHALRMEHPGLRFRIEIADEPRNLIGEGLDLQITIRRPTQGTSILRRLHVLRSELAASPIYLEKSGLPNPPSDPEGVACILSLTESLPSRWTPHGSDG